MSLLSRLKWITVRRRALRKHASSAHWLTFVSKRSTLHGNNKLAKGSVVMDSEIGAFTYVAGARIMRATVGSFCSVGPDTMVGGLSRHPVHWISTHPAFYSTRMQAGATFSSENRYSEMGKTVIGNDVWIGAHALILDGVEVGDGAVIGAGAVVTKHIPPFAVVGGVPAKLLKYRFPAEVIESLLDWKWWNLPADTLALLAADFCSRDQWKSSDVERIRAKAESLNRNEHPYQQTGPAEPRRLQESQIRRASFVRRGE